MPANSPSQGKDTVSADQLSGQPLHSEYADDPDMQELVEMFVSELPERAKAIEDAVKQADIANLTRLSHQLKGAAGGYGFTPITDAAAVVESLAKAEKDLQDMEMSIAELLSLCRRATSRAK